MIAIIDVPEVLGELERICESTPNMEVDRTPTIYIVKVEYSDEVDVYPCWKNPEAIAGREAIAYLDKWDRAYRHEGGWMLEDDEIYPEDPADFWEKYKRSGRRPG